MKKGDYLNPILRSGKTVFTAGDIALLWNETDSNKFRVRLQYYLDKKELISIRRGVYAKDNNYRPWELATRIYTPSYISFESVLAKEGVIFQYHEAISAASYLTRIVNVGSLEIRYKKMKNDILMNTAGLEIRDEMSVATKERALLDLIYANKDYYFDNLSSINWEQIQALLPIYQNNRMKNIITKLQKSL